MASESGPAALLVLVEDDPVIAELVRYNLEGDGHAVRVFRDGESLLEALGSMPVPDLFLLDVMLPGMDGYALCALLRSNPVASLAPIVMLTARSAESDRVRGLDTGADDYVVKPFGIRELLSRVNAQLRRTRRMQPAGQPSGQAGGQPGGQPAASFGTGAVRSHEPVSAGSASVGPVSTGAASTPAEPAPLRIGDIVLDDLRHRVFRRGAEVPMTHREYELLKFMMLHRGVAFSRDELLNRVWGYEYAGETRTVDVHVRQLRRKLEEDDRNPVHIETVRGRGYRFRED